MPRNTQRPDVTRQEIQRLDAKLTSLIGRTARQTGDSDELPVDAVDTANIANDAVTEDKIADGAVTFKKLASGGTTSGGGGNYSTLAETRRSSGTTTCEIYYTARPDGDGYAESEVTTSTPSGYVIERRLYYSDKFDADPDTSVDWTLYTTQPADDTAFATAKTALLAGLSDTDGTANTRGTLPVSLKMEHRFTNDLLLEEYPGSAAAYSIRQISADYTGSAIRIREDSGNTETDIGFDANGELDVAAIASHCGTANGYVVTWYDQSGNSRDATQTTTADQPQIYDGSAVLTRNGQPAAVFDGSSDYMDMPDSMLPANINNCSVFTVQTNESSPDGSTFNMGGYAGNDRWFQTIVVSNTEYFGYGSSFSAINIGSATTAQRLITAIAGSTQGNAQCFVDGTSQGSVALASATPSSGSGELVRSGYLASGTFQEAIVYHSDQSTNRTAIESNIDTYYETTTSFIGEFSGAAAAYSVRCLTANGPAALCMKVRRDSDNATQNIGFDSNGDLDTAAIAAFCGAANGYVDTWFDQSDNGHHATQATTTLQPQIYNGSSVITENGRPAIDGNGSSTLSTGRNYASTFSAYAVVHAPSDATGYIYSGSNERGLLTIPNFVSAYRIQIFRGATLKIQPAGQAPDHNLVSIVYNGTSSTIHHQGSLVASGNAGTDSVTNMQLFSRGVYNKTTNLVSEIIFYESDHSANRTAVESNLNAYYSIY